VQVIPQHVITRPYGCSLLENSDPAARAGVVLFPTALALYGGVLWSGELQGLIVHEMVPGSWPLALGLGP
jgi:hypothetical protein